MFRRHFITWSEWIPEIVFSLKQYSLKTLVADLEAGFLVSVVAFPSFMTFAIASGVAPSVGIITCVVAGILACLFGGTKFLIIGPAAAFVIIVSDMVNSCGFEGMTCSLIIAAVLMIIFAIFRVGDLIHYVPYPIIAGFTAGIGLSVIMAQLGLFLGLSSPLPSRGFFNVIYFYYTNIASMNFYSFALAVISLTVLVILQKYRQKFPAYFLTLIIGILYSLIFNNVAIETIDSKFGSMSMEIPRISIPKGFFSIETFKKYFSTAFAIAFLGSFESLIGAVMVDNLVGEKHRSNTELIGQGIANLGSALCGGMPVTCVLALTSLNMRAGAGTSLARLFKILFVITFVVCLKAFIGIIPLSCLAAMLMHAAWNMTALNHNKYILLAPKSDSFVFISTILITLFVDIVTAVQMGLILSAVLFVRRSIETTKTEIFLKTMINADHEKKECECVRIHGHLFFGVAPILNNALKSLQKIHDVIHIDINNVPFVDITVAKILCEFITEMKCKNIHVMVCGINKRILNVIRKIDVKNEFHDHLFE